MRPGAKKSIVWNYFKKNENDKAAATCNICNKTIKCCGGTTNLKQHLLRIHPIQLTENEPPKEQENLEHLPPNINTPQIQEQSAVVAVAGPSGICSKTNKNYPVLQQKRPAKQLKLFGARNTNELSESEIEKIDMKLLKMVTKDYQPLSIVEDEGFLEYSRQLQPLYKPPSRKRLSNEILSRHYAASVGELKLVLNNVKNIAITTDIWTSDSNRAYITVTGHFISENKLTARVLATEEIIGAHTGENIAVALSAILNEWNIINKIITIVSDNGANIKKAINECLQNHHHPCVAHTLNLSVNEAITSNENLSTIIKKCRSLVGHFKQCCSKQQIKFYSGADESTTSKSKTRCSYEVEFLFYNDGKTSAN